MLKVILFDLVGPGGQKDKNRYMGKNLNTSLQGLEVTHLVKMTFL